MSSNCTHPMDKFRKEFLLYIWNYVGCVNRSTRGLGAASREKYMAPAVIDRSYVHGLCCFGVIAGRPCRILSNNAGAPQSSTVAHKKRARSLEETPALSSYDGAYVFLPA